MKSRRHRRGAPASSSLRSSDAASRTTPLQRSPAHRRQTRLGAHRSADDLAPALDMVPEDTAIEVAAAGEEDAVGRRLDHALGEPDIIARLGPVGKEEDVDGDALANAGPMKSPPNRRLRKLRAGERRPHIRRRAPPVGLLHHRGRRKKPHRGRSVPRCGEVVQRALACLIRSAHQHACAASERLTRCPGPSWSWRP